jgi:voltage-gated potassium channel
MITRAVLRAIGSIVVLVAVYYQLPLQTSSMAVAITILLIGLVLLIALIAFQVRSILASSFPGVRAGEALAISVPLFLLLFASSYAVMARLSAANFSVPLDRTNALYFTVTVFSTVGFGDITATTHTARLVVTAQMIADLVIIGIAIQVVVGAVKRRRGP